MITAAAIVAIWFVVAHNGGAGWVQVLGDLVFGTLFVGILAPWVIVTRSTLRIVAAPGDGIAGQPVEIDVEAGTRLRVRAVHPPGPEVFVGPRGRHQAAGVRITLVPIRRGLHDTVTLDVASAAPFALQWWTRRVRLSLPTPLHVSPRCGRPTAAQRRRQLHEEAGVALARPTDDTGLPRGARPYGPGDSWRRVHWRATAHAGTLMMRESERPASDPASVVVDLPRDPDEAERVAERALGTIVGLLWDGTGVLLTTRETSGPVVAPVVDRRLAGRRLARAVAQAGPEQRPPPTSAPTP